MSATQARADTPQWTGVAPPAHHRPCDCGHPEDRHLLNWRGRRAACGCARWTVLRKQIRCRCTVFVPAGGAR